MRRHLRLPRRLRATAAGKAFLLITVGVGAAAVNTGNNLLYVALSMNLSLIVLSGILSEWTLRGVRVSARPASEAFAGSEAFLAVTCAAGGRRFPGFSLAARIRIGAETVAVRFPDMAGGASSTRIVAYLPARRGRVCGADGVLSTRFPFALFEKSMDLAVPVELMVYPRPGPGEVRVPGGPGVAAEEGPRDAGRPGAFPRGAREHRPADPVRDIHWKASARTGRWMVKERESESAPAVDLRVPVPFPPERFEERLSAACAAVLDLARRGVPFRLWIGDRVCAHSTDSERRAKALAALATARCDDPGAPAGTGAR